MPVAKQLQYTRKLKQIKAERQSSAQPLSRYYIRSIFFSFRLKAVPSYICEPIRSVAFSIEDFFALGVSTAAS